MGAPSMYSDKHAFYSVLAQDEIVQILMTVTFDLENMTMGWAIPDLFRRKIFILRIYSEPISPTTGSKAELGMY